ncbi:hypothetical protein, partial [Megamonas funiformis]|uniref:hypothetical protein n=1 Tax=Megamonas funiformis TaxID=437897 RepID=UPI003C6CF367
FSSIKFRYIKYPRISHSWHNHTSLRLWLQCRANSQIKSSKYKITIQCLNYHPRIS